MLALLGGLEADHELHVFSSAFPADSPFRDRVVFHRVPLPTRPAMARLAAWFAVSPLLVKRATFDVIHTQGADAPVATVITVPCCNEALGAALDEAGDRTWMTGGILPNCVGRFATRLSEAADGLCLRRERVRGIIAPSRRVREDLERLYGVPPHKVSVVPHGVDLGAFSPVTRGARRAAARAAFGLADTDIVVVFVGGAYRLKGLPWLLEALRRMPDRRLKLLAVGVSEHVDLRAERARGLSERLVLTGPISDVIGAYAAGDIFVSPTLYDGFSLATLEAMACGLPVVVSRRAGVADLLTDGVEGFLLERPTDPDEIAHAIDKVQANPALCLHLGKGARRTAEKYSIQEMATRTLEAYRNSLGN